jgi:hypothetical protein
VRQCEEAVWDHHFVGGGKACPKASPYRPTPLSAPTVSPIYLFIWRGMRLVLLWVGALECEEVSLGYQRVLF